MKQLTKNLIEIFTIITKIPPISGRLGVGSMRGTIRFKMDRFQEDVAEFSKLPNYYGRDKHDFKGIDIKYLEKYEYAGCDEVEFFVEIKELEQKYALYKSKAL